MPPTQIPTSRLKAYNAKRDFTKTPEPSGAELKKPKRASKKPEAPAALRFCVQKHLASHLHYDFRLEHHGVMLSWAVPKGPSLRPSDKRLAMRVEDHPYDYRTFEGVIPEGYGAGIVMLWDEGTWHAEVDNIDAALTKGDLKFRLDGTKLKGSWVLVRTHGRPGAAAEDNDRSWLLIKHRDEWSGDVDITEFAPLSVKSFTDLPEILAAENPQVWKSHRPAQGGVAGKMFQEVIAKAASFKKTKQKKRASPKKR